MQCIPFYILAPDFLLAPDARATYDTYQEHIIMPTTIKQHSASLLVNRSGPIENGAEMNGNEDILFWPLRRKNISNGGCHEAPSSSSLTSYSL